ERLAFAGGSALYLVAKPEPTEVFHEDDILDGGGVSGRVVAAGGAHSHFVPELAIEARFLFVEAHHVGDALAAGVGCRDLRDERLRSVGLVAVVFKGDARELAEDANALADGDARGGSDVRFRSDDAPFAQSRSQPLRIDV